MAQGLTRGAYINQLRESASREDLLDQVERLIEEKYDLEGRLWSMTNAAATMPAKQSAINLAYGLLWSMQNIDRRRRENDLACRARKVLLDVMTKGDQESGIMDARAVISEVRKESLHTDPANPVSPEERAARREGRATDAVDAIVFALKDDDPGNGLEFLRAWLDGSWEEEWPEYRAFLTDRRDP
jgi:hypothetical protein